MENNIIIKALESLRNNVGKSDLTEDEKHIVSMLIEKVTNYYVKRYEEINKYKNRYHYPYRMAELYSKSAEFIVDINNTIQGKTDVIRTANDIYKDINYDVQQGKFKRKRLI